MGTSYLVRIVDTRSNEQLGMREGCESPFDAGRTAAAALATLMYHGGRHPEHLRVVGLACEDANTRPLTDAEAAGMKAALEQFKAEVKDRFPN